MSALDFAKYGQLYRNGGMKVLFMSGYADDEVMRRGVIDGRTAFLQKPFTPAQLAKKIRDVLDQKGQ